MKRQLSPDQIQKPREVIHPTLDWVNNQELIVGVTMASGPDAVVSSARGLIAVTDVGEPCRPKNKSETLVSAEIVMLHAALLNGEGEIAEDSGRELHRRLCAHLERFVVFPDDWGSSVVAWWILGSFVYPIFQTYPYLRLTSDTPGCGKSLLGELIAHLSFNGECLTSPNESHLFRLCELTRGVQVWDEIETNGEIDKKKFEAIKPILLTGYRNAGAVPRQSGRSYETTERFHLFCPRVFIGLSDLPEPATQRTICMEMKKCTLERNAEHYIASDHKSTEIGIQRECILWALCFAKRVAEAYRDPNLRTKVIGVLSDVGRRADDIWLPLFAVATTAVGSIDIAGSPILRVLAQAAKELSFEQGRENPVRKAKESRPVAKGDSNIDSEEVLHLRAALDVLAWKGPVEPTELAKMVGQHFDAEISVQWLSKRLGRLGINSTKKNNRRVVAANEAQLREARNALVVGGQEGHDGQELQVM